MCAFFNPTYFTEGIPCSPMLERDGPTLQIPQPMLKVLVTLSVAMPPSPSRESAPSTAPHLQKFMLPVRRRATLKDMFKRIQRNFKKSTSMAIECDEVYQQINGVTSNSPLIDLHVPIDSLFTDYQKILVRASPASSKSSNP